MIAVAFASYQVGYAVSGIIIGLISDRFGRKKALILSLLLEVAANLMCASSRSINEFILFRFLLGLAGYGQYLSSLVLCK